MGDARSYLAGTALAVKALFGLLRQYNTHKVRTIGTLMTSKSRSLTDLEVFKKSYSSTDTAREVIAGSILQIAYVAIRDHANPVGKSEGARHFESELRRLQQEVRGTGSKPFELPSQFCVGRDIGDLPVGMIIYAARNQYNHSSNPRLSVVNEVVFNYLHSAWPTPPNELSFNIYDKNEYYCYSCLAALGWVDSEFERAYEKYMADLSKILDVKE